MQAACSEQSSDDARRVLDAIESNDALLSHLEGDQLTFVSAMAGVGGRTCGYRLSDGWSGVAIEKRKDCVAVHRHNDPDTPVYEYEMTRHAPVPEELRGFTATHFSAGPPCQPFSRAGVGAGAEDSRNAIPAALAAIEELRPLVVELENVANIRKYKDVVSDMFARLASLGYHVSGYVLDAAEYGVPQRRRRFFVMGSLLGPLGAPTETAATPMTVAEAIGDTTDLDAFRTSYPHLELTRDERHRAERLDMMSGCCVLRELHGHLPARTLTASNLANKHGCMMRLRMDDGTVRRPSVMEAARLQSFPATFEFPPELISERQAWVAIGNAVPPTLAEAITRRDTDHIESARSYFREIVALANDEPDLVAGVLPRLSRGKDSPSISDVTPQEGRANPEEDRGELIISSIVSEISSERNTDDADVIPTAEQSESADASEPAAASCGDGPGLVGAVMGLAGNPGSITDTTGTHWAHALQSAREVLDSVTTRYEGGRGRK